VTWLLLLAALVSVDWSTCTLQRQRVAPDGRRIIETRHLERFGDETCAALILELGECVWTDSDLDGRTGPDDLLLLNQCWGLGWTVVPLE
jgi:hypothetical protein